MHARAAEFRQRAKETYGFDVTVHEFSEGTKTAADAAAAIDCEVAQIASSIVFVADGEPIVAVTSGANRVSESKLANQLGVSADDVRTANPDEITASLGWSIGGVPPFCHDTSVPVLFDESLTQFETVWAAAGTPSAVFPIAPAELREYADATVANIAE